VSFGTENKTMKTTHINAAFVADAKTATERRFRNILANSGQVMESGEVRDLANLYVMGYDGELYRIADLNTNPDKQTERYSVKAQADHGLVIDGELMPSIEKQFGSCKVWLEEDGLHARMYFADGDQLADHAWAISQDASYSIGMEWYEDGYYGTGKEITEPIGILREISMVLTGNDPRAKTIDQKPTEPQGQGAGEDGTGNQTNQSEEETVANTTDNLTPDENVALKRALTEELSQIVDKFTTDAPESETEPTADSLDAEESAEATAEAETEAPAEEATEESETKEEETKQEEETVAETEAVATTDKLTSPVVVVKDKAAKQEAAAVKYDWLHSEAGHKAFADTLRQVGRLGASFDAAWRQVAAQHMSLDGITGLPNPAPVEQYFVDALEKSDGIIAHFEFIAAKSFRVNLLTSESRAQGHRKGDTKVNQSVTNQVRDALVKMVYKRLDLDATELYENPWLIDFRSRELVEAIIAELERAAIIGDGRQAPTGTDPDYRLFDGTRGLYSVLADCQANSGIGTALASSVSVAGNLYDGVTTAKGNIKTEGRQILIVKGQKITDMRLEKTANGYLVQPGARIEDILGVERVYAPSWMDNAGVDAILLVDRAYKHGGERNIRVRADFDTSTNTDILLDETPRWGTLAAAKSAVAITLTEASE
jgi:hypothetical protein